MICLLYLNRTNMPNTSLSCSSKNFVILDIMLTAATYKLSMLRHAVSRMLGESVYIIHTAIRIDTRLAVAMVSRFRVRIS